MKGYGENVLTFETEITDVGVPVTLNSNGEVSKAAAGNDFIGFTSSADGKIAGVIIDGYVEAPYTGTAPSYGFCALVSNGTNGVKTADSGATSKHIVRVLKVDKGNEIVGFIL